MDESLNKFKNKNLLKSFNHNDKKPETLEVLFKSKALTDSLIDNFKVFDNKESLIKQLKHETKLEIKQHQMDTKRME